MPVAEIVPPSAADCSTNASTGNLFAIDRRIGTLFVLSPYYTGTVCTADVGAYRSRPRIAENRIHV